MADQKPKEIKLRHLKIHNFKAFDLLEIDFPPPRMKQDPDIIVMGSKNGLGKTSILESCGLLFLGATAGEKAFRLLRHPEMPVKLNDLLIRAGSQDALIEGTFVISPEALATNQEQLSLFEDRKGEISIELLLHSSGEISIKGKTEPFREQIKHSKFNPVELAERFLFSLAALNSEPLILPSFLYFHSYRKVQEGNPELGMMVERDLLPRRITRYRSGFYRPGIEPPISAFKLEILRSMMSQAELFEDLDDREAQDVLSKLNELVRRYAGGSIEKLRPSSDNTVDFRITPTGGGASFSFDGLSSGQKEIISTLFLIWRYTKNNPGIVLIDEPELHLNSEWQMGFIQQLHELAPNNQYIIATHSEDIFASVEGDRRLLLKAPEGSKQ